MSETATPVPIEPDDDEPLLLDECDVIFQGEFEAEYQQRQWLRLIKQLMEMRSHEADPSDRVQLAYDMVAIAACERACRILSSDLPPVEEL